MYLNRVRPLLETDNRDQVMPEDWTPPLFQEGSCPPSSSAGDLDDSASFNDDASATINTVGGLAIQTIPT